MESGSNSGRTSSQATASSRDRNLSNSESTVPDWLKNVSLRFASLQVEILIAILISWLLLRMRDMYVASIRLDFHWERVEYTKRNLITRVSNVYSSLSDHACFDRLTPETYAKHSIGAKAFWRSINVARSP